MPPFAMVLGPTDVPVGEKGCLTSATCSLPSASTYFCALVGVNASEMSTAVKKSLPIRCSTRFRFLFADGDSDASRNRADYTTRHSRIRFTQDQSLGERGDYCGDNRNYDHNAQKLGCRDGFGFHV